MENIKLKNKPERLEWFRDLGLGLFIHWSLDSQLGSVISHSMAGASDEYVENYINILPKTFNPRHFNAEEWAELAKLAGFRYVVFTTKHHNGFCMYNTATTDFNIMNTPYGKDIVSQVVTAFHAVGIHVGFYFSPEDFSILHKQSKIISRKGFDAQASNNPGLRENDRAQIKELLSNYEEVELLFYDSFDKADLCDYSWQLKPSVVITRGGMKTPEQKTPKKKMDTAWESCYTIGSQWQYKPTNEKYKSGTEIIEKLIDIRSKGGNLLLNIGPEPSGRIPVEQERLIRELALWMFVNRECIYGVRPWTRSGEGNVWFTKKKDEKTVYVIVKHRRLKYRGKRIHLRLKHVRTTKNSKISVLGHAGKVYEYQLTTDPEVYWTQKKQFLKISFMRAQRLYNNNKWPNPVVLKITNVL